MLLSKLATKKKLNLMVAKLRNPETQDYNFELTKMDPELYAQIQNLKDNEVSPVYKDQDRVHPIKFKIMTVTSESMSTRLILPKIISK
ncbi:MAG: hypothetical protein CM15mP58_18720 [Burkholderiaceae bacterium]|nr:MAG: hypothetical protein CM15mP58_18720 [Burkholderiaceae bacterium]